MSLIHVPTTTHFTCARQLNDAACMMCCQTLYEGPVRGHFDMKVQSR